MQYIELELDTVSKRLRSSRILNNFKQNEVARRIGVSDKTYSNYELGVNAIPHDKLIKIVEALNSSFDFLLLGKDVKKSREEAMINIRQNTQFDTKIEGGCLITTSRVPLYDFVG